MEDILNIILELDICLCTLALIDVFLRALCYVMYSIKLHDFISQTLTTIWYFFMIFIAFHGEELFDYYSLDYNTKLALFLPSTYLAFISLKYLWKVNNKNNNDD